MRARAVPFVASLFVVLAGSATAGDDPAARIDGLAQKLLASDPAVRERAERDLTTAPPEDLRALVRLLRDRAMDRDVNLQRDPFVGAAMPAQREKPSGTTKGVHFDVRVLALEPDVAAKWLGCPTGTAKLVVAPVPPANLERLVRRPLLSAAGIAAFEAQDASLMLADQTAYVCDFDVKGAGDGRVADPVIGSVSEGLYVGLRGRHRAEGGFHVDVDVRGARVQKPIPAVEIPLEGLTSPVRIQVPTTTGFRSRTATDVGEEGSFLIGDLGPAKEGGGILVALVTVRSLDLK